MSKNYNNYYKENRYTPPVVEENAQDVVNEEVDTSPVVEPEKEEVIETTPAPIYKIDKCSKLNVRSKPSKLSDVLFVLDKTDEFTIEEIKDRPEWLKIKTTADKEGFCMKEYVVIK